jgi:multidrug efflux pump subunit AcrA (membrane-fusion protein)
MQTLKQKKVAIPLLLVLLLGGYILTKGSSTTDDVAAPSVATPVQVFDPQALVSSTQSIEATGTVETLEAVELSSEVSARVARVSVALGDTVRRGQTLVVFNNADLAASLAGAEADLESAKANRKSIEAQYASQEATIAKIKTSGDNAVSAAESALRTAENNLRQSASANDTQVVRDAYVTMVQTLQSTQDVLQSTLTSIDTILGIDNEFANDAFEDILSVQNLSKKSTAEQLYINAKEQKIQVDTLLRTLSTASSNAEIDAAIVRTETTLATYRTLGIAMSDMLDVTPPIGGLTQSGLDGLKATVQSVRSQIAAQSSAVTSQSQRIDSAKNSFGSLEIAYDKAVRDLAAAKENLAADMRSGAAQLAQIDASLELQDAQIKSAGARVSGIRASISKTVITAPISGTIAALPAKVGELMSPGMLAVRIVNTGSYQVKVFVPAESVSRIETGNKATIANIYTGIVTNVSPSIDPTTNKVEVILLITEDTVSLVSDQFVTVTIEESIDEFDTLSRIPLESVRLTNEGATVFVVTESNILEARTITIGQVVGATIEADIQDITLPIVSSLRGLEVGDSVTIQQ